MAVGRRQCFNPASHPPTMVLVRVETPLRPTEDEGKVKAAIHALWPDAAIKTEDGRMVAKSHDLRPLRQRVWELRIIDAVRGKLLHGITPDGKMLGIRFSKQAALARQVSFPPTPHALGDLDITIQLEEGDPWPDLEKLARWFAPETKEGEIVGPVGP